MHSALLEIGLAAPKPMHSLQMLSAPALCHTSPTRQCINALWMDILPLLMGLSMRILQGGPHAFAHFTIPDFTSEGCAGGSC